MHQGNERCRVLITGVTGFVGSYLAKYLLEQGFEIYGLVRRRAEGRNYKNLIERGILNRIKILEGEVTDLTSLLFTLDKSEPDIIFHLAAQSFVPSSYEKPFETFLINSLGTQNLLEAVRLKDLDSKIIFAGSSEEYGLQIISQEHYEWCLQRYGRVIPEPTKIPELPINENNPLRPLSPYAVSKVHGEYLMRNYWMTYGLKTVISRAFNHEGAGRGPHFVTSSISRQCVMLNQKEVERIRLGNPNAFRDWSHVEDIVRGYHLLAEKGMPGDVYVLGSARTNSVLTYALLTLEKLGYKVEEIDTIKGGKRIKNPLEPDNTITFGMQFEKTKIDVLLLNKEVEYTLDDKGLIVKTNKGDIVIEFAKELFRPLDVPILLSDPKKAMELGFKITAKLDDIIRDQINYYLDPKHRIT